MLDITCALLWWDMASCTCSIIPYTKLIQRRIKAYCFHWRSGPRHKISVKRTEIQSKFRVETTFSLTGNPVQVFYHVTLTHFNLLFHHVASTGKSIYSKAKFHSKSAHQSLSSSWNRGFTLLRFSFLAPELVDTCWMRAGVKKKDDYSWSLSKVSIYIYIYSISKQE